MNRDSFVIEISSEQQDKISNIAVSMSEYSQDMSMGRIYIYEYDLVGFDEFRAGLMTEYNLKDVQQATWIKPRNPSKPVILTFKEKCLPEYIEIAGEQAKTKVYECISSPMCVKDASTLAIRRNTVRWILPFVAAVMELIIQVVTAAAISSSATIVMKTTLQSQTSALFTNMKRKSVSSK